MRADGLGRILCPMWDDTSARVSAVANAVIVLMLALIPMSVDGRQIDHEQVRPWGCRTCLIPAPTTERAATEAALGSAPVAGVRATPAGATACDGNCPGWVEMLIAACAACPPVPEAEPDAYGDVPSRP